MSFEKSITTNIVNYLNSLPECIAEKVQGNAANSGRADINACYKGRCIRIEVKTPDNKNTASIKQEHNLKKWKHARAVIMVTYTLDSVKDLIQHLEEIRPYSFECKILEENGCESWFYIP